MVIGIPIPVFYCLPLASAARSTLRETFRCPQRGQAERVRVRAWKSKSAKVVALTHSSTLFPASRASLTKENCDHGRSQESEREPGNPNAAAKPPGLSRQQW